MRVTEEVSATAADDHRLRTQRVEKRLRARGRTAVVSGFQDAERRSRDVRQERSLGCGADVAGQHDRYVAVSDLEYQRIVVADTLTLPIGRGRMPGAQGDQPVAQQVAGL